MNILFKRNTANDWGTQGEWIINDKHYCYVLEPNPVILPAGEYILNRYTEGRHPFPVLRYESLIDPDFINREIEVHPGNVHFQTSGCTLPGAYYGKLDFRFDDKHPERKPWGVMMGILESQDMFDKIMTDVPDGASITVLALV